MVVVVSVGEPTTNVVEVFVKVIVGGRRAEASTWSTAYAVVGFERATLEPGSAEPGEWCSADAAAVVPLEKAFEAAPCLSLLEIESFVLVAVVVARQMAANVMVVGVVFSPFVDDHCCCSH